MRPEDLVQYRRWFPEWRSQTEDVREVVVLSPCSEQLELMEELFPSAWVTALSREQWDLGDSPYLPRKKRVDLVVAQNVFMYSPDPPLWFENVAMSCRYFWMQDVTRTWRGGYQELGQDGDSARYCHAASGLTARIEGAYDLSLVPGILVDIKTYSCDVSDPSRDALSFLAFFKS